MAVQTASFARIERMRWRHVVRCVSTPVLSLCLIVLTLLATRAAGQEQQQPDWQAQVRNYCDASDWPSAMRLLEQQIARAPDDLDLKAWRARVLAWSGNLAEARQEYLAILKLSPNDPDNWAGLASVYAREGKKEDALRALDTALRLDPKRADLHAARARALRALGKRSEARAEFQKALTLDPPSAEARAGLKSLRAEPKHELRVGNESDFLSYTAANEGNWASLATRWSRVWATSVGGGFYRRGGVIAEKFIASVTARLPRLGAVTAGGAVGHDNSVIPKSEAYFDLDRGWKTGEGNLFRGVELDYGQHWYWYQSARILTLNGAAVIYLPREWSLSLAATGARSAFSGTGVEWRPSGSTRLGFPLAAWRLAQLSGNIFFAAGSENFALSDQIGRFASQSYGGGLRFRFAERQDITCVASYQRRTQGRTDTYLGFSYGIHF
jgi:tetratricopeptide (TPR) repeat protein